MKTRRSLLLVAMILAANISHAADPHVETAMRTLQDRAAKLGPAKIEGTDAVAGKQVPALYFGATKMNNNSAFIDEVVQQAGGTATLFVKNGDEFVRVATNVKTSDGARAIGTTLDPHGQAIAAIRQGKAFYGEVDILGKPYVTGYEPIRVSNETIGIEYVGYPK